MNGAVLQLTQHSRFVAVAPRPSAHFAFATLRQNVGYAGNVMCNSKPAFTESF
jgi:hypothetical protein